MKYLLLSLFLIPGIVLGKSEKAQKRIKKIYHQLQTIKVFIGESDDDTMYRWYRCVGERMYFDNAKEEVVFSYGTTHQKALDNLDKGCFGLDKKECLVILDTINDDPCQEVTTFKTGIKTKKPWKCSGILSVGAKNKKIVGFGKTPDEAVGEILSQCTDKNKCRTFIEVCAEEDAIKKSHSEQLKQLSSEL